MSWSPEKTIVNSWNEWDPLKHVIVGKADDCHIPPLISLKKSGIKKIDFL